MYSKVYSAAIFGVEGRLVTVEADLSDGLPSFDMVGALSTEVKEAASRVRTALKNVGATEANPVPVLLSLQKRVFSESLLYLITLKPTQTFLRLS